jgi:hypothetical protein
MIEAITFPAISLPALALVLITSVLLLLVRDWRWMLAALALQYAGVFMLVALAWPLEMAVVKVITGWMAGAVLGVGVTVVPGSWQEEERFLPSGRLFRLLAVGLVALVIFSSASKIVEWLPGVGIDIVIGSFILIGNGLLHLGLTTHPLRVAVGLLTVLSGFEILYAALQVSALVAGLLAGVNLGLALAGVFLIVMPSMEAVD